MQTLPSYWWAMDLQSSRFVSWRPKPGLLRGHKESCLLPIYSWVPKEAMQELCS
jgi:hypothetical protein